MCHLPAKQSRAFKVFCRFQALVWCWIGLQDLGSEYSEVQGSRLHAYACRSFAARWRWWIREKVCKVPSTLAQKLLWSLQFYEVETSSWWKVYMISFACVSQQWRYMLFCGEYSTRNNPLHNVLPFGLDALVRKSATALRDEKFLAKLRAGDL